MFLDYSLGECKHHYKCVLQENEWLHRLSGLLHQFQVQRTSGETLFGHNVWRKQPARLAFSGCAHPWPGRASNSCDKLPPRTGQRCACPENNGSPTPEATPQFFDLVVSRDWRKACKASFPNLGTAAPTMMIRICRLGVPRHGGAH